MKTKLQSGCGLMTKKQEKELTEALFATYQRVGEEVHYWARRFLQSLRTHGGLGTAQRMLTPKSKPQRAGLDRLIKANRPKLTVEHIVQKPEFRSLFTVYELAVAKERLAEALKWSKTRAVLRGRQYPDELDPNKKYVEGARKQVLVNAYERNAKARKHCIRLYGACCIVCKLVLQDRYGMVGKDFIHVHHLRPVARAKGTYVLDPKTDLVPVCPNCHAMLHRPAKMLTPEQLRVKLKRAGK